MDVRTALAQRVNDRFMKLRAALEPFDDESAERVRVGPSWNVRDLTAHLAYWTDEAAQALLDPNTAGPPDADRRRAINEELHRRNRRMSFVMLLPQLRAAQERLLNALHILPESQLIGETAARTVLDEGVIAHYDHHLAALRTATADRE
jgi:hypothetical protein